MAETEVETILRVIRERVQAQQRAGHGVAARLTNGGNGAGELSSGPIAPAGDSEAFIAGNLSLINSYLATTARAWDRLPPVVSNRNGFLARVELWLKRRFGSGTRWFTWEQVNFNAAVHHALRDLLPVLAAYEAELRKLRGELADSEARKEARAEAQAKELAQALNAQASELQAHSQRAHEQQSNKVEAQIAALVHELRDSVTRLQDEQRVCYKQLALEASEAAVLEDRARRQTEALLEELERRLGRLEKKMEA